MSSTINFSDVSNQAISLWERMTKSSVMKNNGTISIGGLSMWRLSEFLRKSISMDLTGTLTLALIDEYRWYFLDQSQVSFGAILRGDADLVSTIDTANQLDELLTSSGFQAIWKERQESILSAVNHYRENDSSVDPIKDIAQISFDALSQFPGLRHLVLRNGPMGEGTLRYNKLIYRFPSAKSLFELADNFPQGFSLGCIIPEETSYSHFVLIYKTGMHVSLFSDVEQECHPLQSERRRNDRSQVARISDSGFPYDILDIEVGDSNRHMTISPSEQTMPVVGEKIPVLTTFDKISPDDIVFLHILFEKIFDSKDALANGKLGISTETLMLGFSDSSTLPAIYKDSLPVLPDFSNHANSSREKFLESQAAAGKKIATTEFNKAFEELLGDQVATIYQGSLLPIATNLKEQENNCINLPVPPLKHVDSFGTLSNIALRTLGDQLISTEDSLADAHWLARHNYAETFEYVLLKDFHEHSGAMSTWFSEQIQKIVKSRSDLKVLKGLCDPSTDAYNYTTSDVAWLEEHGGFNQAFGNTCHTGRGIKSSFRYASPTEADSVWMKKHPCLVTGGKSRVVVTISASNPMAISGLTGVGLNELPRRLQLFGLDGYTGNSILQRLDPVEDAVNPYKSFKATATFGLSLEGLASLREIVGLKKMTVEMLKKYQ